MHLQLSRFGLGVFFEATFDYSMDIDCSCLELVNDHLWPNHMMSKHFSTFMSFGCHLHGVNYVLKLHIEMLFSNVLHSFNKQEMSLVNIVYV